MGATRTFCKAGQQEMLLTNSRLSRFQEYFCWSPQSIQNRKRFSVFHLFGINISWVSFSQFWFFPWIPVGERCPASPHRRTCSPMHPYGQKMTAEWRHDMGHSAVKQGAVQLMADRHGCWKSWQRLRSSAIQSLCLQLVSSLLLLTLR
jgi:hypothetical protein